MRLLLTILFVTGCITAGYAQADEKQAALAILQKMTDAYQQATGLSFNVTFRYAAAETPANWLDSLNGRFVVNGRQYWCAINNTETICTGGYVILLFKEDQLMYLSKPTQTGFAAATNMAVQMDEYLKSDSTIRWSRKELPKQQKITLEFTVPAAYKRIEFYINKRSGFLEKMISVVKSDQLYDPSVRHAVDAGQSYAVIEAVYSNHRQGAVDSSLFNAERYFKKEGSEYITATPYKTYTIFRGSSNL